jgi:hypothetical protein
VPRQHRRDLAAQGRVLATGIGEKGVALCRIALARCRNSSVI